MADYDPQRGRARAEAGDAAPVDDILGGEAPEGAVLPSVQSAMAAASKQAASKKAPAKKAAVKKKAAKKASAKKASAKKAAAPVAADAPALPVDVPAAAPLGGAAPIERPADLGQPSAAPDVEVVKVVDVAEPTVPAVEPGGTTVFEIEEITEVIEVTARRPPWAVIVAAVALVLLALAVRRRRRR